VFIEGDALELNDIMLTNYPELLEKNPRRLVIMVGNSLGILPHVDKNDILNQMAECAGPEGLVLLVNWKAQDFGNALQHFYNKMPSLCGELKKGVFDFDECTFSQPDTGYLTKWWTIEESEKMVYLAGWDVMFCQVFIFHYSI